MSYRSTSEALRHIFISNHGWLLLLGHGIFAIRTATLWLSRGKDAVPTAKDILSIAWYWPVGVLLVVLVVALFGLYSALRSNWPRYKSLISADYGRYLGKTLPLTLAIPLLLGLLLAWGFGLDVFGGTFASVLTLVQIAAAVVPLIAKAFDK